MMNRRLSPIILTILMVLTLSCQQQTKTPRNAVELDKNKLIELNRLQQKEENYIINQFIERSGIDYQTTGTGLRYHFLKDLEGENAKAGNTAIISFTAKLLNGDLVYQAPEKEPFYFVVSHDDVESGIHQGIQLMSIGDEALFILPSHLAFGLTGDHGKIPPKAAILYQIKLLALK